MQNKWKYLIPIIILLAVSGFLLFRAYQGQQELAVVKTQLAGRENNARIVNFTKLFIKQVLKAETEVSFETRLKLENAVRDLGDVEILAQWQKFTDSKTEIDAQQDVKNLLELLVDKMEANQKVLRE
ncbi:MAG: hypothetical protein Q8M83_06050 [bacterium]|nr:hypothetical protein [bacterium]